MRFISLFIIFYISGCEDVLREPVPRPPAQQQPVRLGNGADGRMDAVKVTVGIKIERSGAWTLKMVSWCIIGLTDGPTDGRTYGRMDALTDR